MDAPTTELSVDVTDSDHASGSPTAAVTLVEYGDYQCPYCAMAHPEVKRLQAHFGDSLRFVFRNFPLTQMHPMAQAAAEIAEAAALLGQFWPMHDWLYEHQDDWVAVDAPMLEAGLRVLGLDEAQMERALRDPSIGDRIRADFKGGVRSGVNGTPCFFVDGHRVDGGVADLEAAISSRIGQAGTGM